MRVKTALRRLLNERLFPAKNASSSPSSKVKLVTSTGDVTGGGQVQGHRGDEGLLEDGLLSGTISPISPDPLCHAPRPLASQQQPHTPHPPHPPHPTLGRSRTSMSVVSRSMSRRSGGGGVLGDGGGGGGRATAGLDSRVS